MRILWSVTVVFLLKIQLLFAGGDGTCSPFISKAIEISDTFTSAIDSMQSDCIRSLSLHAVIQSNQPYTDFANALYEIYSHCAKSESDLFVDMYDELHNLIDPSNIHNGDTVGDYLSGSTDTTRFPFLCVAENIESALDLLAIFDKELTDASNMHLKHHQMPKEDSIES
ncbi:unnamed protein product [Chironomus riparius]|uniref:Pectinesterase inhibitor domain-containing protein n=1 Tax=Chironomus riparius TaxID=315576 RepID=A0A9N9S997_9DIPT|nr:unnamed protein product [Chironomus riparius]